MFCYWFSHLKETSSKLIKTYIAFRNFTFLKHISHYLNHIWFANFRFEGWCACQFDKSKNKKQPPTKMWKFFPSTSGRIKDFSQANWFGIILYLLTLNNFLKRSGYTFKHCRDYLRYMLKKANQAALNIFKVIS